MKKLLILFFFLFTSKLSAVEDSCLSMVEVDCYDFGYTNADSVLSDTCSGYINEYFSYVYPYYAKKYFSLLFTERVFNWKATIIRDTLIIFNNHDIDSLWQNLPPKFDKMKSDFKFARKKFGDFYLIKVSPDIDDTTHMVTRLFNLSFENYNNVDTVLSVIGSIDNITNTNFRSYPGYVIEALRITVAAIPNKVSHYIDLSINEFWNYGYWNIDYIELLRSDFNKRNFKLIKTFPPGTQFSYEDSSVNKTQGKYYYTARARAKSGCYSPFSDTVMVSYSGVDENEQGGKNGFIVAPNPASDYIEISVGANGRSPLQNVEIYNVFGLKILSIPDLSSANPTLGSTPVSYADSPASGGHIRVDVSGLAAGVYFVKIGSKTEKFVIVR